MTYTSEVEGEDIQSLLPQPTGSQKRIPRQGNLFRPGGRHRALKIILALIILSFALFTLSSFYFTGEVVTQIIPEDVPEDADPSIPPHYASLRQHIAALPQHNLSLPFPEGSNGRYVKFSSQISQLGWNNVLNEVLMNAHLAYRSNRAYVFMDYDWKLDYYPWPEELMYEKPPKTPLAALMSGPVAGGEWPEGTHAATGDRNSMPPRAVSAHYFELVCPPHRRRIVRTSDVKPWDRFNLITKSGREVFDTWLSVLTDRAMLDNVTAPRTTTVSKRRSDANDPGNDAGVPDNDDCIEIIPAPMEEDNFPQVFDLWLWGTDRVLSLWDEFKASPIASVGLGTSEVVERCLQRNMGLFRKQRAPSATDVNPGDDLVGRQIGTGATSEGDPLEKTLAIHIRRGDYKKACQDLADYNSTYYSWNQLPLLPDHFTPPPYAEGKIPGAGNNNEVNVQTYLSHCLPDDDAIVKKVEDSRRDWEYEMGYFQDDSGSKEGHFLETLFLLTNEKDPEWLGKLRSHFLSVGSWKSVVISSLEVVYGDAQEKDVGMAVDMELATRAAVFIGNGFSSFTSNILHRRLVDGKIPISNRFF